MSDTLWQAGLAEADKLSQKQNTQFSTQPIQDPNQPEPGFTDYLMDIPRGIGAGLVGAVQGVGGLADKVVESFGGDLFDDEGSFYKPVVQTKTWLGGLVNGLTQFATAFIPFAGVAGKIGKALELGKAASTALRFGAAAAADFSVFNEHQERLSNLIQEFPALQNPVTEYLSAKPTDSWAEGRFKNALEGLGLGAVTDLVLAGFRGFKNVGTAAKSGDAPGFVAAATQAAADVEPKVAKAQKSLAAGLEEIVPTEPAPKIDAVKSRLSPADVEKMTDEVIARAQEGDYSDLPFEWTYYQAIKSHINWDKLKIDSDTRIAMENLAQIADDLIQKGVGGVQSLALTKKLAREVVEIYGRNGEVISAAAEQADAVKGLAGRLVAFRTIRNAVGSEVTQLAAELKAGLANGVSDSNLLGKLKDRIGAFLNIHYNTQIIQAEAARTVSSGRIMVGVPNLNLERMLKRVDETLRGGNKAIHPEELVQYLIGAGDDTKALSGVLSIFESGAIQKTLSIHNEYWINSLLSGVKTQMANIMNQLFNTILMPADRIFGGLVMADKGMIKSGFRLYTGLVTAAFDVFNLAHIGGKMPARSSVGSALQAFWQEGGIIDHTTKGTWQKAITGASVGLSEANPVAHAINYLGKFIRLPARFMTGVDELFKQVNFRSYLRDEALRLAEEKGLTGSELGQFVSDHIAKAFGAEGQGLNQAALLYAQRSTMTQPLLEGTIGRSVQTLINQHPGMRMFAPFVRVPTNIFRTAVQYTPGINFLQKEFRQKWLSSDHVLAAEARGRFMMGGMFWGAAASTALSGKITGGGPTSKEERDVLLQSGWRPYSFKLENEDGSTEYIEYRRLEPFGMILGLVADYVSLNRYLSDDDNSALAQAMTVSLAHNLTSKTYLTGLSEVASLLSQPDRYAKRWLTQRLGSYVPNIMGQMNPDDYLHDTRSIMDGIIRRIPGLSETLPPRRNMFGEAVSVPQGYLPFGAGTDVARMSSPVGYSKSVSDPVKDELARLQHGFGLPARKVQGVDLTQFQNSNGQDAYDRLQELHGQVQIGGRTLPQALEHLIGSARYQKMPYPETENDNLNPRVREIQSVIANYRDLATHKTLKEYPEINQTIKELQQKARTGSTSPVLQKLLQ